MRMERFVLKKMEEIINQRGWKECAELSLVCQIDILQPEQIYENF